MSMPNPQDYDPEMESYLGRKWKWEPAREWSRGLSLPQLRYALRYATHRSTPSNPNTYTLTHATMAALVELGDRLDGLG